MTMPDITQLATVLSSIREKTPLVHCMTNYVTVNDCANVVLGVGASPIMSDEVEEVAEITSLCNALVLNIGTLHKASIAADKVALEQAAELSHPVVLDPVGAGASVLRTQTALELLEMGGITLIRGNMSEIKTLAGKSVHTRGVDVDPSDQTTQENLAIQASFACDCAASFGAVVAITGAIDVISDGVHTYAVHNGCAEMGTITGTGCMLSAFLGACAAVATPLEAALAGVTVMGIAGEIASERTQGVGNGTFRMYLLDALSTMTLETFVERARIEQLS